MPKIAAIALIFRFCLEPFGDHYNEWGQIVFFLSVASMFLGAIAAINQSNIKRLLAYSSIGHMGYALAGLATGINAGIQSTIMYITIYLLILRFGLL